MKQKKEGEEIFTPDRISDALQW